ncbi:MAG: AAA family ATPase, partial [bacterium]|nr:AAA family ATPase [bacterium]
MNSLAAFAVCLSWISWSRAGSSAPAAIALKYRELPFCFVQFVMNTFCTNRRATGTRCTRDNGDGERCPQGSCIFRVHVSSVSDAKGSLHTIVPKVLNLKKIYFLKILFIFHYVCNMIERILAERISGKAGRGKAIIIIGPRQVGKTTLIKKLLRNERYHFFDGDDPRIRTLLDTPNTDQIRAFIGDHKVVFIDEAQRINNIGLTMKIIIDQLKDVQLWISGSSSFSLFNELNEPLTGRKWEYELFPISWEEFEHHVGFIEADQQLERRLVYGMYPDVLNNPNEEPEILGNLVSSYLYKDVLSYAGIRKPQVLDKLIQALALQIG